MTVRSTPTQSPFANFKFTRASKIILGLVVATSLGYLLCGLPTRAKIAEWIVPSASQVFEHGKVWTLLTGPLLELDIIWLLMLGFTLLSTGPQLEGFWGSNRMLRFAGLTTVAGSIMGTLVGLVLGRNVPVFGIAPFVFSYQIAFGLVYWKQPMRLMGAVEITGRHLVYGTLALVTLYITLQQLWVQGGAMTGAIGMTFWLTSRRYNPRVLWTRWQIRRSRAHLSLVPEAQVRKKRAKTNERFLN
jgi:membrane associated rhomboid family serine protease